MRRASFFRRVALCAGVVAAVAVVFAALGGSAHARVPGSNGLIAFVRSDKNTQTDKTYIVNPDGTDPKALLVGGSPHWSADGSLLAIQTPYQGGCPPCASTTIFNPDTGHTRVLSPPDPNIATGCSLWSPDASHFACDGENDSDPSVNGVYTVRTTDGRGLTRITNAGGMADIPIDYSPDGKRLVFGRVSPADHSCTTTSALYVVNLDGTGLHQITPGGFCDDDGSWSPDGTEIAFASGTFGRIYVVHPDGTGLMQIPIPVSAQSGLGDVSWSPDGSKLAFIRGTSSGEGIYTANANGTGLRQVTSSGTSFDHEADWGPHPLDSIGKPPCVVPKLKGKTLPGAKRLIKSHHCAVGTIKHARSRTIEKGHVISQRPKPGRRLNHGAKVDLTVSKGP
jgi:Tol biopolymer transport system component